MDRPFDSALQTLAELAPRDWLRLVKRRRRSVTVEDSDIGTVISGATDKLFRVHDDPSICYTWTSSRVTSTRNCPCGCGCIIAHLSTATGAWC
jgi:hypothetical protein